MAVTASFQPSSGILSEFGDELDNNIVTSRDAAGNLLVNGGAVKVTGPKPTVANTSLIQVFGQGGNDSLWGDAGIDYLEGNQGDDALSGGDDDDDLIGGSSAAGTPDGSDTLNGDGGHDVLAGDNAAITRIVNVSSVVRAPAGSIANTLPIGIRAKGSPPPPPPVVP